MTWFFGGWAVMARSICSLLSRPVPPRICPFTTGVSKTNCRSPITPFFAEKSATAQCTSNLRNDPVSSRTRALASLNSHKIAKDRSICRLVTTKRAVAVALDPALCTELTDASEDFASGGGGRSVRRRAGYPPAVDRHKCSSRIPLKTEHH